MTVFHVDTQIFNTYKASGRHESVTCSSAASVGQRLLCLHITSSETSETWPRAKKRKGDLGLDDPAPPSASMAPVASNFLNSERVPHFLHPLRHVVPSGRATPIACAATLVLHAFTDDLQFVTITSVLEGVWVHFPCAIVIE